MLYNFYYLLYFRSHLEILFVNSQCVLIKIKLLLSKCLGHTCILCIMPIINYYSTSCLGHPPGTNYSCNNVNKK